MECTPASHKVLPRVKPCLLWSNGFHAPLPQVEPSLACRPLWCSGFHMGAMCSTTRVLDIEEGSVSHEADRWAMWLAPLRFVSGLRTWGSSSALL